MDIVRKYLLPVYQAPDPAAPAAIDPAAPPAAAALDPAAPPLAADPAPAGDPAPAVDPTAPAPAAEHGNKGKQPWFLARIADETAKRHQTETELQAERQRRLDAEALAARLQGGQPDPAAPGAPRAPAPTRDSPDFQTAVQQEAARQRLYDDSLAIKSAGITKFGADFNNTLSVLNAVGATTDDFVTDVISVDKANAHALLHQLAQDPEKAASLAGMNPRARIAELTRMSMATAAPAAAPIPATPAAPAARTVSRAPAPPPPVEPSASKTVDGYADEATDEQFTQQFNERMKARAGRR